MIFLNYLSKNRESEDRLDLNLTKISSSMSMRGEKTRKILFLSLLSLLFWPILMIIIGIRYRNQCSDQPQLSVYHIIFGSIWLFLFFLNIIRYYLFYRIIDIFSIIIWLILLILIIPGYIYIFSIRNRILIFEKYPNELCEKNFYVYSSVLIILVHIPLYIYLWISWSFTHSNSFISNPQTSIRIFSITNI